jgi:uncharacterized protein HemX
LQSARVRRTFNSVKGTEKIASPASGASWTKPEAYIGAMARKRSYRKAREEKPRSQPVAPRPSLSTIPFAALLAVLAVLAVAIMFIAFPGAQPAPRAAQAAPQEQGVAQRGWFQEAQKDMHRQR